MTLATEWQARLSADRRLQLTNPDNRPASTEDATRLAAAVADTQAEFERITGRTFLDTDADHIRVGVLGVTAYLLFYGPTPDGEYARRLMTMWKREATNLVDLSPATTSLLTPSDPDLSGGPVRPDFDREHLDGTIPRAPNSGTRSFPPGFFG